MREPDVLVVGGGAAGMACAATVRELGGRVLLVSKEPIGIADTKISTGLFAVPDHPDAFLDDIQRSGEGLVDESLARTLAAEAEDAHRFLEDAGVRARSPSGARTKLRLPMGGHSAARSVSHSGGGRSLSAALLRTLHGCTVWDDAWVTAFDEGNVAVWHARSGEQVRIKPRAVVLATGGLCALYAPHADVMRSSTGDGYALALRAGASLVDMEQVQFTPFGFVRPRRAIGLPMGEGVLAGPRGVLRDASGVFATDLASKGRAEIAALIASRRDVVLDLRDNRCDELWNEEFRLRFRHVLRAVRRHYGVAAARFEEPWPVLPTAHYHMGGIRTDVHGATEVPGLFAVGQAMGGVHGANRLGSTSLPTAIVFGRRAARAALESAPLRAISQPSAPPDPLRWTRRLQAAAWRGIGPLRDRASMESALRCVEEARAQSVPIAIRGAWDTEAMQALELHGLLDSAEAIARSGLARRRSLGAHCRRDSRAQDEIAAPIVTRIEHGRIVA
ncbi:MAG: FAD-binding protein [Myxococcota bacterium]